MPETMPNSIANNEILQRFYSTLERIVLFFAFDFTIDWKQPLNIFNRQQPQNQIVPKMDYSKLRRKCIDKPTVPPRTSPRKHVRGKIQTYEEPKIEALKKSSVEKIKNGSSKSKKSVKNAEKIRAQENIEISKIETELSPIATVIEEDEANMELEKKVENSTLDTDVETQNPFSMLLQPIINLWSNVENEEKEELTDFKRTDENDHSSATNDSTIVPNDDNDLKSGQDELHKNQAPSEMDILEEALNESPEKFIDTILAMNNVSSSPIVVKADEPNHEKSAAVINDSFGQQILAQAGKR
uniref:Uncharacterized protein n=1 Tax=Panagrolaimus davidi TaxID=227884 RepID=A0A914PLK1_9BILA